MYIYIYICARIPLELQDLPLHWEECRSHVLESSSEKSCQEHLQIPCKIRHLLEPSASSEIIERKLSCMLIVLFVVLSGCVSSAAVASAHLIDICGHPQDAGQAHGEHCDDAPDDEDQHLRGRNTCSMIAVAAARVRAEVAMRAHLMMFDNVAC